MTDKDLGDRQLNAIVGAALRALAESGADDEMIGSFAASHRVKVAKILGHPEEALQPPDLQQIIQQSVHVALHQAGITSRPASRKTTERFNVEVNGRRTSLSIDKTVVAQLLQTQGNKKAVNKLIGQIVQNVPNDIENRSAWVEERIDAFLSFGSEELSTPTSAKH